MLPYIFLDVRIQFWRAHNFDIICESAVEPIDSGIVIDSGLQNPVGALPGDVLGGKRIFLHVVSPM